MKPWMGALLAVVLVTSGCAQLQQRLDNTRDRGPGSNYGAYLAGSADTLVVELDYSPGALWDTSTPAEEQFKQQLERITKKRIVIKSAQELPSNGDDYSYSAQQLVQLHRQHQDRTAGNGTAVMHALFLDGEYQGDVAGLAFAAKGFAIFTGSIEEKTCSNDALVCNGVKQWRVMRAVAIHEAGHLFGLVNSPLPMVEPHEMTQDPRPKTQKNEGDAHSTNESSVMFWKVESSAGLSQLIGGGEVPWRFGTLDIRDARAIQGG